MFSIWNYSKFLNSTVCAKRFHFRIHKEQLNFKIQEFLKKSANKMNQVIH